jgi:tetratricopeptide (TPR) repeat protein
VSDQKQKQIAGEIESALIDAELFLKYKSPERAIKILRTALEHYPLSIPLREQLREVAAVHKDGAEAARQCLALASLYIERDDFDTAYDRLLQAKSLDPRINIAPGLDAIRKARRPDLHPGEASSNRTDATFAGDLALVSIFDAIQVVENSRLTGTLVINSQTHSGSLMFNSGKIVDASQGESVAEEGFLHIIEATSGIFDFVRSEQGFPVTIVSASNTNLVLDTLRLLDEKRDDDQRTSETPRSAD